MSYATSAPGQGSSASTAPVSLPYRVKIASYRQVIFEIVDPCIDSTITAIDESETLTFCRSQHVKIVRRVQLRYGDGMKAGLCCVTLVVYSSNCMVEHAQSA